MKPVLFAAVAVGLGAQVWAPAAPAAPAAQEPAPGPELVPQVEISGALLLAPREDDPERARLLEPDGSERFGALPNFRGVAQWRDPRTHEVLRTLPLASWPQVEPFRATPTFCALSPDGSILATHGSDGILLWQDPRSLASTPGGASTREWPGQMWPLSFSPDGSRFVSRASDSTDASGEHHLVVRAVQGGDVLARLLVGSGVWSLSWSPDSQRLAAIEGGFWNESDVTLSAWSAMRGAAPSKYLEASWRGRCFEARFLPDGSLVALSGTREGEGFTDSREKVRARRWSAQGQEQAAEVTYTHTSNGVKWRFLPDGRLLTSGNKQVPVGDKGGYREVRQFHLWNWSQPPRELSREQIISQFRPWHLALDDYASPAERRTKPVKPSPLLRPVVAKRVRVMNGRVLVADDSRVWDVETGRLKRAFSPTPPQATALDIAPGLKYFGSGGGGGAYPGTSGGFGFSSGGAFLGLWRGGSGGLLWHRAVSLDRSNGTQFSEGGAYWSTALRFSPEGERVAIGSAMEATLSVHAASSGRKIWSLSGRGTTSPLWGGLEWSPDGRQIAVASLDWAGSRWVAGLLRVHEAAGGRVLREWNGAKFGALAWSRDGQSIAVQVSPQEDGGSALPFVPSPTTIEIRGVRGGEVLQTLRGAPDKINAIQQSPDGTRWAACGRDGAVRVWNAEGRLLNEMRAHAGEARDLAWKSNSVLISVGDDGTTRFWNARAGRLVATAILLQQNVGDRPRAATYKSRARGRVKGFGGGVFEDLPSTQWLLFTPDGFYDASPGAEKFVRWRVGARLFPANRYKSLFFKPETVRRALSLH